MSVLVFAENAGGIIKKATLEALSYGSEIASTQGTEVVVLALGSFQDRELARLANYGATKIWHDSDIVFNEVDGQLFAKAIIKAAKDAGSNIIILSSTYTGKTLAPIVAVKYNASLAPNAIALPEIESGFTVKRTVFSNKGFANFELNNTNKVISLIPNAYKVVEKSTGAAVTPFSAGLSASDKTVKTIEVKKVEGKIPLTEAELVISAGRGMKGPENWHHIETLANTIGAATACSKPVSDMEWRPHSEHVGQTGITIKPNLYIAIGISGAIQHLAGVSGSKVIVAINTDKEAPFFKAADYGIVGDALEIVPKLTEAFKKLRAAN